MTSGVKIKRINIPCLNDEGGGRYVWEGYDTVGRFICLSNKSTWCQIEVYTVEPDREPEFDQEPDFIIDKEGDQYYPSIDYICELLGVELV